MICDIPIPHDPHHDALYVRENGTMFRDYCEGRTAPVVPSDVRPLPSRPAVDIARENLTQPGRAAIEAFLDARDARGRAESALLRAKRHENELRDEMLAILIAMPAGADNADPGRRIPDYLEVVREERRGQ